MPLSCLLMWRVYMSVKACQVAAIPSNFLRNVQKYFLWVQHLGWPTFKGWFFWSRSFFCPHLYPLIASPVHHFLTEQGIITSLYFIPNLKLFSPDRPAYWQTLSPHLSDRFLLFKAAFGFLSAKIKSLMSTWVALFYSYRSTGKAGVSQKIQSIKHLG